MGDAVRPSADSRRPSDAAPDGDTAGNAADRQAATESAAAGQTGNRQAATETDGAGNSDAGRDGEGREPRRHPPSGGGRKGRGRRRLSTRHITWLALAVAVGHIIYAFIRDHALDLTRGSW